MMLPESQRYLRGTAIRTAQDRRSGLQFILNQLPGLFEILFINEDLNPGAEDIVLVRGQVGKIFVGQEALNTCIVEIILNEVSFLEIIKGYEPDCIHGTQFTDGYKILTLTGRNSIIRCYKGTWFFTGNAGPRPEIFDTLAKKSSMKSLVSLRSKLPNSGTSIFAVMSGLANEVGAINLSQGFPNFPVSGKLIELVHYYMKQGMNQYAPMQGVPALREAISEKVRDTYGLQYNPATEITITAGATQAIFSVIAAVIRPGDEAIVIEPAYDSYAPSVELNGGIVRYASLKFPDYKIDWLEIHRLINNRTRMIMINSPHNPTGSVLAAADLAELDRITRGTDILVMSDEVYEHLIFDGIRHESVCLTPSLAERSFVIGSFGKTFHTTGWKTGFVLAPAHLMAEFRKAHQFIVFAGNTPMQYAMADFLADKSNYLGLPNFYQQKRDHFVNLVKYSRFRIIPSFGTYFQLLDYSRISEENEVDFAVRVTKEFKLASVPVSPFYHDKQDHRVLRFCFAKTEETMEKAAAILCKI